MKKKLLSFFSLTAIAIIAFAATQISRRAGDPEVLWSSETPVDVNWGWNIAIPVEKCANVAIGDVIDVTVAAINSTEQEWSTQITLCDEDKKAITETYNIGKQTAPYVASFPVTGDMYKYIKENGFRLGGGNCTISKVELRKEVYKGSENSIWIGSATESNITIDLVHLVKAGIKKGDIIRVTLDATDWTQDVSGWVKLQYIKGESYTWTPFEESDFKTINRYDKTPVDFVLLTDAPATILKDVTNNHGLVVQGGSKTTITQVEVLTGYTVNIATGIENGTIKTDKDYAAEGDEVTITATPNDGYELDAISVRGVTEDIAVEVKDGKFTMPADAVTVSATFKKAPVDVTVEAGDITGGDITAAIAAKVAATGAPVKNLTINLAAGDYTITAPIEAYAGVAINGVAGAKIDASTLTGDNAVVKLPAGVTDLTNYGNIEFNNVNMKIATRLVYANKSKFWIQKITVDNCVIAVDGTFKKSIFDCNSGGNVKLLSVNNSTICADPKVGQNGGFFSSQSSQKPTEFGAEETQTFQITNSTLYNITNGNNMVTLRETNKNYLYFTFKNNVIVNCGKNKEFYKGFGSANLCASSTWDVDGNVVNFNGVDTSADDLCGGEIKNPVTGIVAFTDAAAGDFNGKLTLAPGTTAPATMPGDPRWTLTAAVGNTITIGECTGGTVKCDKEYAAEGDKVYATFTPNAGYSPSGIVPTIKNDAGEDVTKDIQFVEDETGSYLIMPAFNITVSAVFQQLPKFYIIGGEKDWKLDDMTEMTYNKETDKYEYEIAPTTTIYFAFSDKQFTAEEAAAADAWNTFNSTNRYSLGAGNVDATLNEIKSLTKGVEGTIVLKKVKEGTSYKISVEKDFNAVTISGEAAPVLPYVVAGSSTELFGTAWAAAAEANAMKLNETTGKYEITYSNVTLSAGDIEYKIVKDGSVWIPDGENLKLNIPAAGTYDVTFTIDPATNKITAEATVPTGINGIYVDGEAADIFSDGKPVYNLSGQRVFKGYKGVVIKNGKKIVVK